MPLITMSSRTLKNALPIKLAYIIPSLDAGGAEKFAATFCSRIDRKKFEPTLIVLGKQKLSSQLGEQVACNVVYLDSPSFRAALPSLVKLLRLLRPEIVISGLSYLIIGLFLIRYISPKNFKLVSRETSILSLNNKLHRHTMLWNAAYKLTLPRVDLIICQTKTMRDDLCRNFNVDATKLVTIGNPINVANVRQLGKAKRDLKGPEQSNSGEFTSRGVRFVFVGGLRPEKKVGDLIEALAQIDFEFTLEIIGSGSEEQGLRNKATLEGLQQQISFLGYKTNPYPYIKAADALLISSAYEGFPNVALEALALQTPVLTTPAGGTMIELASQLNGCFVSQDDTVDAFSRLLSEWFRNKKSAIPLTACKAFDDLEIIRTYETSISSLMK